MIRIGFYSEATNIKVKGYLGLYGGSFIVEYMDLSKDLKKHINWFFETTENSLDIEYNEKNWAEISKLCNKLKKAGWEGTLRVYTDDENFEKPDFTFLGYDVGADSMYYSPLGDGFLLDYDPTKEFFSEMTAEKYLEYKRNINEKWLFNSYAMALDFAKYCNHINRKHRYCIESEDNWRPFAIYLLEP